MESADDGRATSPSDQSDTKRPQSLAPLPGRPIDMSVVFEQHLTDLIRLIGAQPPQLTTDTPQGRWEWQHAARGSAARAIRQGPVRDQWFEPLVRAAVYDPDPSFNRQLITPAIVAFGRHRVQQALLEYLRTGSSTERAGAARAWYWTGVSLRFLPGTRTPTPESQAEYDAVADLHREWQDTALRVFVSDEDLDVRRCILPGLDLRVRHYPEEARAIVAQVIHIARTHPDDYLRHRVEHQV